MLDSFFNKVANLRTATLLKRDPNTGLFPVNITKFLRTPILKDTCERLLLQLGLQHMRIIPTGSFANETKHTYLSEDLI